MQIEMKKKLCADKNVEILCILEWRRENCKQLKRREKNCVKIEMKTNCEQIEMKKKLCADKNVEFLCILEWRRKNSKQLKRRGKNCVKTEMKNKLWADWNEEKIVCR